MISIIGEKASQEIDRQLSACLFFRKRKLRKLCSNEKYSLSTALRPFE
jgi:hypothetical protein